MTTWVNDTFTDTNGVGLASHVGESGASWSAVSGGGVGWTIQDAGTSAGGSTANSNEVLQASGSGTDGNAYVLNAPMLFGAGANEYTGPIVQISGTAYYAFLFNPSAGTLYLYRYSAPGTGTLLTSWSVSLGTGAQSFTVHVEFPGTSQCRLTPTLNGTALAAYTETSGALRPASPKVGVHHYGNPSAGGVRIASISAVEDSTGATGYTISGPSAGTTNQASTVFTVTPNGALSGADSITLSAGGGGGTFSPTSLSFASGATAAQTFTYTPASSGTKTITPTSATLALPFSPTTKTYAVTQATGYTVSGPSTGANGSASTNFTVTPTGGGLASGDTISLSSGGGGGTFTPASLTFAAGATAAQTFTYTPASTGVKTLTPTSALSLAFSPTTLSYTSSGPTAAANIGISPSGSTTAVTGAPKTFTVSLDGYLSGSNLVVTPASTGATFSPTSLNFAPNGTSTPASQTFTATWASAGTKSLTLGHSGSDQTPANPSAVSVTVSTPPSPTVATPAVTSGTDTSVTVGVGVASGGSGSGYQYELYRSTDPTFVPPGAGTKCDTTKTGSTISFTDTTASPGVSYAYAVVVTDSNGGVGVSRTCWGSLWGHPFKCSFGGDSITRGFNSSSPGSAVAATAVAWVASLLPNINGERVVSVTNNGVDSSTTDEWQPGGANYNALVSAAAANGSEYIHFMLGTNDARSPNFRTASYYKTGLQTIANALVTAGYKVILSYPPFSDPGYGGYNGTITDASNKILASYCAQIDSLVNGTTILAGSKKTFEYFANKSASELLGGGGDGVHPGDTGYSSLGRLWAQGILSAIGETARGGVYPTAAQVLAGVVFGSASQTTGTRTDAPVGKVRNGFAYGAGGTGLTGTDVLPTAGQVQSGVGFGAGATEFTGTYAGGGGGTVPAATDVRNGVAVGATTGSLKVPTPAQVLLGAQTDATVGTVTLPVVGDVRSGTAFGPALGLTGTLSTGGGGTIPSVNDVRSGVAVGAGTGNIVLPPVGKVEAGFGYGSLGTELVGTVAGGGGAPTVSQIVAGIKSAAVAGGTTIEAALAGAHAEAYGKWVLSPDKTTLTKYAADGTTVLKSFTVTYDTLGNAIARA